MFNQEPGNGQFRVHQLVGDRGERVAEDMYGNSFKLGALAELSQRLGDVDERSI